MSSKDDEYFRLQKNIVHFTRYISLQKRIEEFIEELKLRSFVEDDKERWAELMAEQVESLASICADQHEELVHLRTHHNHLSTALRYYVKEYGDHVVSKTFPQEPFMTTVTIIPLEDGFTDIKVEIESLEIK